ESGEEVQQPESPTLTLTQDSPLSSSEGEPKTRSLWELYEVTDEIPLLCLYADYEPLGFDEAMKSKKWRQAMEEEIKSIEKNDTWELITLPKSYKAIRVKWVYKAKKNAKGEVEKYKARIVPAFLNKLLEEEVYVEKPEGYVAKGIYKYFQAYGFTKCLSEYALYVKFENKSIVLTCLYANDLIFTRNSKSMINELKKLMARELEMTYIGLLFYYLGFKVKQTDEGIFMCQERYAKEIFKRFGMDKCNPVGTPIEHKAKPSKHNRGKAIDSTLFKSLIGSLCYLTCTRPNILFAVRLISHFLEEPTTKHLKIAKRILRYIKGTIDYVHHKDYTSRVSESWIHNWTYERTKPLFLNQSDKSGLNVSNLSNALIVNSLIGLMDLLKSVFSLILNLIGTDCSTILTFTSASPSASGIP
nr:reverse transcriptase [Tanacetum cinerariifolium]